MNYDVFISCKSEDYPYAESIYDFLRQNGINTFLASKELRILGDSEYRKAISKALASAYHMIIFASKAEYIDSDWVYYEWDWFITAKLKRKKSGAIITILKDTDVDKINADLWKYESFSYDSYQEKVLNYVETPDSRQRKIELEEQNKKKAEENRLEIIQKIKDSAEDFYLQEARLQILRNELIDNNKALGKTYKECPVCGKAVPLADPWCNRCGFFFSPLYSLDGQDDTSHTNKEYLAHFRTIWKSQQLFVKTELDTAETRVNQRSDRIQFKVKNVLFEMVFVRGGDFLMGAPASDQTASDFDKPQRKERVKDFYIAETQVTQALWVAVMDGDESVSSMWTEQKGKGKNYPAYFVSYEDALRFVVVLNNLTGMSFRIPTESEWEYAARGGVNKDGYLYSGSNNIDDVAWYIENNDRHTQPVKRKKPNSLGIYDMSGNVFEWCAETNRLSLRSVYYTFNSDVVVARGGSWMFNAERCRITSRCPSPRSSRNHYYGLRLALSL